MHRVRGGWRHTPGVRAVPESGPFPLLPDWTFLSMSQPLSGLSFLLCKSKGGSDFTKVGILSLGIINFF